MVHFTGCSIPLTKYYSVEGKIGEGTFGHVFTGKRLSDSQPVAIKRLILSHPPADSEDSQQQKPDQMNRVGFPLITLREIKIIKSLPRHENILHMIDMAASGRPQTPHSISETEFYCIFPLMDHDLAGLIAKYALSQQVIKCLLLQATRGLQFLHSNKIIHRDIKPANILLDGKGIVKLGDFGLARPVDFSNGGRYTPNVLTRWYRAPEVCLGTKRYTEKVDIWSMGCVFGEMLLRHPLLMGKSDMEQISAICNLCGTPTLDNWPDWRQCSPACDSLRLEYKAPSIRDKFADQPLQAIRLLEMVLALNPSRRPSAEDILMHDYFYGEPLPLQPHELPHFDRSNELNTKELRDQQWRRGIINQ